MGWGYTLLGYRPEVISFSAHLKVELVKSREIFIFFALFNPFVPTDRHQLWV